jgi:L-amino acid N-acyltransferase YncA
MSPTVRLADPDRDAEAVAEIYRPAVEDSHASFEATAPTPDEMAERIRSTLSHTPWLVAVVDGSVAGYAYATAHRVREAYRWSVDISVYVDGSVRGRGVGRGLYDRLLPILRRQGYVNVYAGIALPNPASEALHRAIGMRLIGVYEGVGHKHGRWWDVAWYGMRIAEPSGTPAEPIPLPQLAEPL